MTDYFAEFIAPPTRQPSRKTLGESTGVSTHVKWVLVVVGVGFLTWHASKLHSKYVAAVSKK